MTAILQVSDTHITTPGQLVSRRLDTTASLEKLVKRISDLGARLGPIDAVLVSGDLSDDGSPASYETFRSLMASLDLPLLVIPGNHDLREPMREAFADHDYLPRSGRLNWHRQVGDIDVIGLDTLVEGKGGGVIDGASIEFLQQALTRARDRPVLLAMHHPPFMSGIAFMDRIGLEDFEELAQVLTSAESDIRVVCGHIHSTMVNTVGGKMALSSPSPCSSFAFDATPDAPPGFWAQEDGFLLHRWQGGCQSIRIPIESGLGPFTF